jgi:hypothetical protein
VTAKRSLLLGLAVVVLVAAVLVGVTVTDDDILTPPAGELAVAFVPSS